MTIFTLSLLAVSCIDNDYDLSDIDTDDIGIGDEYSVFTCPLMTLRVAVADIVNEQGDLDGILAEADVWLPNRLPDGAEAVDVKRLTGGDGQQAQQAYVQTLLTALQEEIDAVDWEAHSARVDYGFQYSVRFDLLYRAFLRGWERDADAVREFRNANPWVEDYALYMALKRSQDMRSWETWPEEIRLRRPGAAETYAVRLGDDVHFFIYLQYLFFGQWDALRSYVHALGLEIIGDLPIYVP